MFLFPLLTLSLFSYAALAATVGAEWTDAILFTIEMHHGQAWTISGSDIFIAVSLIFLTIEILRSTNTGTESIFNHVFSGFLFIGCLLCFLFVPRFGTSAFFLLTLMTVIDFMAGFIVTTLAARRDFGVSGGLTG